MGIKDRLQIQRDELFGKFVSVKALLEFMASDEGIDPSEVAIALLQAFEETNVSSMPAYGWADAQQIKFVSLNDADRWEHLKELLLTVADGEGFDVGDHFGWLRAEIFKFLGEHGLEQPVCLPAWKPQEVPSQISGTNEVAHDVIDEPLATTERNNLLKQIGVLSLALAEKSHKYKCGAKPNALQIAIAVGEIVDALPVANKAATGVSSVRESIRKGLELLTTIQE